MGIDEYYMGIAMAVRKRADCLGRKVGAVLVKENRVISTGYNGTPDGVENCTNGGCVRCKRKVTTDASIMTFASVCTQNRML